MNASRLRTLLWSALLTIPVASGLALIQPDRPSQLNSDKRSSAREALKQTAAIGRLPDGPRAARAEVDNIAGARDYFTTGLQGENPLAFHSFTFVPNGSLDFYTACQETATEFPTDPAGDTVLDMGDDTSVLITLASTNAAGIYGQRTNAFFIGANGYLTTGGGDISWEGTYANHFSRRRVSGLFTDLHPGTGGRVSWRELLDRVAITWDAVPEFGDTSRTNSFQIELFFDDHIRLTYLTMKSTNGIAGLSAGGGTPELFVPSDFLSYVGCALPPTISFQPASQTVPVETNVTFTVAAYGNAPLAYQWWKKSVPIADATKSTLNFPFVTPADAGEYRVVVTNAFGAATSEVATLIVTVPPVVADFSGTPTRGLAPVTVAFTNLSSGATNYFWDFGDGHTSIATNPSNVYLNASTNAVTLTAVGWGGTNVLTRADYIAATNLPPLMADFIGTPTNGGLPLTVTFMNASANATSYRWDFGDGGTSTATNLTHVFTNAGAYTVSLLAQRGNETNVLMRTNYILVTNVAPTIVTQPVGLTVKAGTNATFIVTAIGTPVLFYQWRFNGTNLAGATATAYTRTNVQLRDAGDYSVVVSNVAGSVTSAPATLALLPPDGFIQVTGAAYSQNFDAMGATGTNTPFGWYVGTGTGAVSGTNVTVTDGSASAAGNYNFGTSGGIDRALGSLAGSTTQRDTEARFVNVSGRSLLAFTISYAGEQWRVGGKSSVNNDLVLQFSLNGTNFTALGTNFNFNTPLDSGTARALNGNAVSNRVTGLGGTFTLPTPLPNNQVFYLRWADADNSSADHALAVDDVAITFTLSSPPPVAGFTADFTNGPAPLTVNFTNLSTGATNYVWDFGDGNSSASINPVNTYSNAGNYTVTLIAVGAGGTNVLTQTNCILVTNAPPVADFVASVTNGYAPLTVFFTNLTANALTYTWAFGDSHTATTRDAANTYSQAGSYTIMLMAVGAGGTNTLTRTNHVIVANPPLLTTPTHDGTGFSFSFATLVSKTYSVQFKDSLDEPNWRTLLPPLIGTGGVLTFTDTPTGAMRFYRLQTP